MMTAQLALTRRTLHLKLQKAFPLLCKICNKVQQGQEHRNRFIASLGLHYLHDGPLMRGRVA